MRACHLFFSLILLFANPSAADQVAINKTLDAAGVSDYVQRVEVSDYLGWQQIWLRGGRIIYVSDDGRYLLQGSLIKNTGSGLVNLTEGHRNVARAAELEELPPDSFIVYRARNMQTYITVFTDAGCPFCQKFHSQVSKLTANGVGVRYLPFPRSGIGSEDYYNLVSIWCSDDQRAALERAKKGRRIVKETCETHPVDKAYELGSLMGVVGTPAIFLEDGSMHIGFIDAKNLLEKLNLQLE